MAKKINRKGNPSHTGATATNMVEDINGHGLVTVKVRNSQGTNRDRMTRRARKKSETNQGE